LPQTATPALLTRTVLLPEVARQLRDLRLAGHVDDRQVRVEPLATKRGDGGGAARLVARADDDRQPCLTELSSCLQAEALVCSSDESDAL